MREFKNQIIPHMGVLLTTACNLNCKDCADLMSYRPNAYYPSKLAIEDLQKILDSVDKIAEVLLIGGEIMLYRELPEVLSFCLNNEKIDRVTITTNGTLMPSDKILRLMESPKAVMRISGYDRNVAPNRPRIIETIKEHGILLEDLEGMFWGDMGDNSHRHRTKKEMEFMFENCCMADCIGIGQDGKVFFCSRHMTAYETEMYPTPPEYEYVDVRNSTPEMLRKRWPEFYSLKTIGTCEFCDGLVMSKLNKVMKPAVQKIGKEAFLTLISISESNEQDWIKKTEEFQQCLEVINNNLEVLVPFESTNKVIDELKDIGAQLSDPYDMDLTAFRRAVGSLVAELTDEFKFEVICDDPSLESLIIRKKIYNLRDVIKVHVLSDVESANTDASEADMIITKDDILNDQTRFNPIDEYTYNRLYLEANIEDDGNAENIIAGLSYTQYGIDINEFTGNTINLSAGGMDLNYSIQLIKKYLENHTGVRRVMIPIPYYLGFYDMESSKRTFHEIMKDQVIYPVLKEQRFEKSFSSPFRGFIDMSMYLSLYWENVKSVIKRHNYFNEYHSQNPFGGLESDCRLMSEEEKNQAALKTANGNGNAFVLSNLNMIRERVERFIGEMNEKGIKAIFFTPPFTERLRNFMNPEIEERFKEEYNGIILNSSKCIYMDMYADPDFTDDDFSDFEHLNHKGAVKMSRKLNELCK